MNKFVVALATVISLGLAIPAFAEEKNDAQVPAEKMGKQDKTVLHHHYNHKMKSEAKPQ